MTDQRLKSLMDGDNVTGPNLTAEEIAEGWHFCIDWDGLLIGPGMGELESCTCGIYPGVAPKVTEAAE